MTTRELFESKFPVPEGVSYYVCDNEYISRHSNRDDEEIAAIYNAKWIGFQAGWEAAKQQGEVK